MRKKSSCSHQFAFSIITRKFPQTQLPLTKLIMVWPVFFILSLAQALCTPNAPTIRELTQLPNPTWVENIAVRSNGQLLVTLFSSPELYQIDPTEKHPTPKLVATFPECLGILGITEIQEDVFAITKGNFSLTGALAPKSFSVWKADFRNRQTPTLSSIVDIPEAVMLNGATTVTGKGSKFILIADSIAGVIWRVNLETQKYDIAYTETATQPTEPFPPGFGANGVHTRNGFLYFTKANRGFYRVPIHDDGTPAGPVKLFADLAPSDDFTFDEQGNAYVARGAADIIAKVAPTGAAASMNFTNENANVLIEGNTALAFGRTLRDLSTLYVTTNGGWSGLVNGTEQQGGKVLAIEL